MDSEDEGVIFENSVLHQTLQEIGVTDIETEPKLQVIGIQSSEVDNVSTKSSSTHHSWRKRRYSFITYFICGFKVIEDVYFYNITQTLRQLTTSQLLSEEDRSFLQYFIGDDVPMRNPMKHQPVWSTGLISLLVVTLVMINIFPLANLLLPWTVLFLDATTTLATLQLSPYPFTLVLINFLWLLLVAWPVVKAKQKLQQQISSDMKTQEKAIKGLETQALELMYLEKKCLRLIKESELVARGFIVASQHHLVTRQTLTYPSLQPWCSELRHVMLIENIRLMTEMKKEVVKMMRGVPMFCVDCDFNTLEVLTADSAVDEIEDPTSDSTKENKRNKLLCNKKIVQASKISKSVALLSVYISGCIRRLALCFYQANHKDKTLDPYSTTQDCTERVTEVMKRAWTTLNQHYKFCRAVHYSHTAGSDEVQISHSSLRNSQIYNLYICVNSLDLHLQALLLITRDLTRALEERVDREKRRQEGLDAVVMDLSGETTSSRISTEDMQHWEEILKRIKMSLESCRACYEESLKHVTPKQTTGSVSYQPVKTETNTDQQTKITVIPADDPVILDQVFEGISEAIDEDFHHVRHQYTAEDKVRLQEQRETIKRLRQELQSVVGLRAIAHREREERAIARTMGQPVDNIESSEPAGKDAIISFAATIVNEALAEAFEQRCMKKQPSLETTMENAVGLSVECVDSTKGSDLAMKGVDSKCKEQKLSLLLSGQDNNDCIHLSAKEPEIGFFNKMSHTHIQREIDNNFSPLLGQVDEGTNSLPKLPINSMEEGLRSARLPSPHKNSECVKISHTQLTSPSGNKVEVLKQDISLGEVLTQSKRPLPSLHFNCSFTKGIALLAAARAKNFNSFSQEEEAFEDNSTGSDSDIEQVENM